MMYTANGYAELYKPRDNIAEHTFDIGEIEEFEFEERIGIRKDSGSMVVNNDHGDYTALINSGDRIDIWLALVADEQSSSSEFFETWGADDHRWGEGAWGGSRLIWSALVRDVTHERETHNRGTIDLDCEDYAFGVLGLRNVYNSWEERPFADVIRTIFRNNTPELNVTISDEIDATVTVAYDGKSAFDVIDDLCSRADAVARAWGNSVAIRPFEAPTVKHTLTGDDIGIPTKVERDDELANYIRVDGPQSKSIDPNATVEGVDRFRVLTADDRLTFQVETRKSEIDTVELLTDRETDSALTVRLQADDGGQPVNPEDQSSDIARRKLSHQFIAQGDWTEFLMPEHTLPPGEDPWVIVEPEDNSQRIGVNENGDVSRRIYFPYPVNVIDQEMESIRKYIRREDNIQSDGEDVTASREKAEAELKRRSEVEEIVDVAAESRRAHMLRPGEVVDFADEFEHEGVEGPHVLLERSDEFENVTMETTLSFQSVRSL